MRFVIIENTLEYYKISLKWYQIKDFFTDNDNADALSIKTLALEKIIQEEREDEILHLDRLSDKVYMLHTNLLYYRNPKSNVGAICYEAWKTLIKQVGSTPNAWRELGSILGIPQVDLDYVTNSVKDDPTDIVLKVFMQNDNATIDKILDAIVQMNRYDILKAIEIPFSNLALCFNKDDSGYHSVSNNSNSAEIISFTNSLFNDLPPVLKKKLNKDDKRSILPSLRSPEKTDFGKVKDDSILLFLTYAEDGEDTALNIQQYVENWESPKVTILTLNDRREDVYQNTEKFIREHFEKANFVVPIITPGYMNRINSNTPPMPCTNDNLDYKYVNFIYNLLINHYIYVTGCLNEKARSVLPQNINANILAEITMYPALLPWTFETNFNEQFKAFLKKCY